MILKVICTGWAGLYHPVNDRWLTCDALGIFLTVNHLITKPTLIYFQCNQKSLLPLYLINVAITSLWNLATMPILIHWYYKWNCLKIMNERESYITLWSHSQDSWQQPRDEVMVEGGPSQKSMLRLDIGLLGLLVCVVLFASERTARVLWGSVLLWEPSTVAVMVLVSRSGSSWVLLVASPSSGGRCSFWEWEKRERRERCWLTF